jgi:pimeloyl-ACP methyl ester carboxylesterase
MADVAFSPDGIPVCYEVHGSGEPALVLVHGWSCDRSYWSRQLDHFVARYQVVTIDLAGHGESGVGREAWTIRAFGDDVIAVVEKLALADIVLIGHSMGGDVIVEAALQLAERVRGLVWVDAYNTLGEPNTREALEEFVRPFREDFVTATRNLVRQMFVPSSDTGLVEWVVADMSAAPPEIAVAALEQSVGNDHAILAGLGGLAAPVAAINPEYRPTDIESLQRHGVMTVLMSGVGHFLMLEDPDTFNRLLGEVIDDFKG